MYNLFTLSSLREEFLQNDTNCTLAQLHLPRYVGVWIQS
jgi:hypothetical protein